MSNTIKIPRIVFIVPYRNRPQHKYFFSTYMSQLLKDTDIDYEIYISHQCDARSFNRGATKNIGFIAIKNKYPEHYKNMTFVFNDIDTVPFANIFNYETTHGIVKHFYGFNYALGGIVSMTGADFEATNGYPNFWGWGMEDNVLQKRCEKIGLQIDRSQFFPIGNPQILQLFDGVSRLINRKDPWRATHDNSVDGIRTIHKLEYTIDFESDNPLDNIHVLECDKIHIINIKTFMTGTRFESDNYYQYDIREPPRKIIHPDRVKTNHVNFSTDDWTNIPFYPTAEKKREMIKEYGETHAEEIIKYSYEHSTDPTQPVIPPHHGHPRNHNHTHNHNHNNHNQYHKKQHGHAQPNGNVQPHPIFIPTNINKFSPAYARIIGAKPKATPSANIKLGGVY